MFRLIQKEEIGMEKKYSEGEDYKVIAFVLARFPNEEQTRIMKQAVSECRKYNCKVVFFSTLTDFYNNDLNDAGEKKIFDTIYVEGYDAIVLMSESFKQDEEQTLLVKRANEAGVPIIAVDKYMDGAINLAFDYGNTFEEVVRHMVEFHGYRTVNFMGGMKNNSFSEERLDVFKKVLADNAIPYEPERIYWGEFWEDPTRAEMDRMLADGKPLPEAIICANDMMAITVCSYLQEKGYHVPEDVAVSGFDGVEMEKFNRPRLTTGIQNIDKFVQIVFEIVTGKMTVEDKNSKTYIYSKMQIGGSCGCANLESLQSTAEMIRLKTELHQQIKYQGEVNQMVANYGNAENLESALLAVSEYMGSLNYNDFWFCANQNLFDEQGISWHKEGEDEQDDRNYTPVLDVLHYCSEEHMSEVDFKRTVNFEELIPDRKKQLEEHDFLLVTTVHMKGKTAGYAVISFDSEIFWYTAYEAFLTNFRHLLEMQKAQIQLMRVYMGDLLTGLYNRNGFYQKIQTVLKVAEDLDMSIISMDMDGLKRINDTYGHAEGDFALQTLGKIVKESIGNEIAARIGGDEFLIAFVGEDIDDRAEAIVTCIQKGIQEFNQKSDKPYELQASIGVYTNRIKNHTLDHFLKKADDLMYARKYLHKRERGNI